MKRKSSPPRKVPLPLQPDQTNTTPTRARIEEQPPGERTVPARMGEGEIPTSDESAVMPSFKMFDDMQIIQRARTVAGDP